MAYLLFAGNDYTLGGAEGLIGKFDTIDSAIAAHNPDEYEYKGGWANVLCLDTLTIGKYLKRGNWIDPE